MRGDVASLNGKAPKRSWCCGGVLAHDNRLQTNGACRGGSVEHIVKLIGAVVDIMTYLRSRSSTSTSILRKSLRGSGAALSCARALRRLASAIKSLQHIIYTSECSLNPFDTSE